MKELLKKITPSFLLSWYHFSLAFLGALFFGFPSRRIKIIGVTGTSGKTTTTEMIFKILEEAGQKPALINSIRFKIGENEEPNLFKMTMPGRFFIQRFLRKAVNSDCKFAVLEVTSEGIKQHRHRFIKFDTAVFTNLSPEHIEAHGSFENYRQAKSNLFRACKNIHVVNLDDENAEYFLKFGAKRKYLYQCKDQNAKCKITIQNSKFSEHIEIPQIKINLSGEFNISNGLAAISAGLAQGISLKICQRAIEKFKGAPGRMETVIKNPYSVIVDYAHTPESLEKVYQTLSLKFKVKSSKLICVLGACGGGRDKWKRPVLGKIASRYCQEIIITNEDPYDEDPNQILSEIKSGITKSQFPISNFHEILDRREAIKKALESAKPNDIVIITGKGCEPWMCVEAGKKIPWDDREMVREEFHRLISA